MLNVLIIDDTLIAIRSIKNSFEKLNHNVVGTGNSGSQAIALAKKLKPDLITIDIVMPGISGIEALKQIKEYDKEVKIIVITSSKREDLMVEALKEGAIGYILKPITQDKIANALNDIFPECTSAKYEDDLIDD